MKKSTFLSAILFLSAVLLNTSCKQTGEDSQDTGGSGADFDSALYYTKYEIDSKLNELSLSIGSQLKNSKAMAQPVSGLGYANGTTSWTIPIGYSGVIFQIIATNTDMYAKTINVHFADGAYPYGNGSDWSTKMVVPAYGSAQVPGIVSINSKTGPVKVAPVYWIK